MAMYAYTKNQRLQINNVMMQLATYPKNKNKLNLMERKKDRGEINEMLTKSAISTKQEKET